MDGGLVTIRKIDAPQWRGRRRRFTVVAGAPPPPPPARCTRRFPLRTLNARRHFAQRDARLHRHVYARIVRLSSSYFVERKLDATDYPSARGATQHHIISVYILIITDIVRSRRALPPPSPPLQAPGERILRKDSEGGATSRLVR